MTWRWSGTKGMDLHEALRAACTFLKPVKSYLEIGVDGGGSLNTVLCEGVPSRIVLCDLWDPEYCGHGDTKPYVQHILDYFGAFAEFRDGDSKVTVPRLTGLFDLVLVDGDHSAEGATADLKNVWPLLRPGGILVMDDIRHPDYPWLDGVFENCLQQWSAEWIYEEHGECNTALINKRR